MTDAEELKRRQSIVIGEHGGILPQFEAFYIYSIHYAAERATDAFRRYKAAAAEERPAVQLVSAIQEALAHAASLSRFFWPVRSRALHQARGERLRNAFKMANESPLSDKSLRDAFEHFDERLDSFLLERDSGFFFPAPMVGDRILADDRGGSIFKLVDPSADCFVLLSQEYPFMPILEEAERILLLSETMVRDGRLDIKAVG